MRDPRANYKQSLEVLRHVKRIQPNMVTKSSLMLGLGESDDEVLQAMKGDSPFPVTKSCTRQEYSKIALNRLLRRLIREQNSVVSQICPVKSVNA